MNGLSPITSRRRGVVSSSRAHPRCCTAVCHDAATFRPLWPGARWCFLRYVTLEKPLVTDVASPMFSILEVCRQAGLATSGIRGDETIGGGLATFKARLHVHGRSVLRTRHKRMLHTMSCSSFATCWETTTGPGVTTDGELPCCPHVAAIGG